MTYLLLEEIESLFRVIKFPRDRAAFSLMLFQGIRASELGMLRLSDWNDDDEVLFVRRGEQGISNTLTVCGLGRSARCAPGCGSAGAAPARFFQVGRAAPAEPASVGIISIGYFANIARSPGYRRRRPTCRPSALPAECIWRPLVMDL
jgi:hypothetical protein